MALLWLAAASAHAAPIYKCIDARGAIAFQDTPCATHVRQAEISAVGQPLIDAAALPSAAAPSPARSPGKRSNTRGPRAAAAIKPKAHSRKSGAPRSWECHAADGEVFYRHDRCPGSVPGDGVVRTGYAEQRSRTHPRARQDAWQAVPVRGTPIPRDEACRRIRSASAAGRDGHRRDAEVSTYDRLMGRDPCNGD